MARATAATMIATPTTRPSTLRGGFPTAAEVGASLTVASAAEEGDPGGEGEDERERGIDHPARADRAVQARRDEPPSRQKREPDADDDAEHPRRKIGAEHVDRRHALATAEQDACRGHLGTSEAGGRHGRTLNGG